MKTLILIRHAKSSWKDQSLADFDRPLNKRGQRDAPVMGLRLAARDLGIDLLLTSPARRARETASILASALGKTDRFLRREPEIYEAHPRTILRLITDLDDSLDTVGLVGHNPALTSLCSMTKPGTPNLPTCGIYAIRSNSKSWRDFPAGDMECVFYDYPKNY